eukprot:c24665_g1_i2 orf=164-931(-)
MSQSQLQNQYVDSIPLPMHKLSQFMVSEMKQTLVALVATGSFNPPTCMHVRIFDLGKNALAFHGFHVLGGYMSPVNNGYGKVGLICAEHRIKMCQLATAESSFIMVDPWEAMQSSYQRTLTVLHRVKSALNSTISAVKEVRVMLLCGADLLESFSIPGVWIPEQILSICKDYGIVCIARGGKDMQKLISENSLFSENKENIFIVDDFEINISSSEVREKLSRGISVKGLVPESVINYIMSNKLYNSSSCQEEFLV